MQTKSEVETGWRWKLGDQVRWRKHGRVLWEIESIFHDTSTVHLWNPKTDSRVMHAKMEHLTFVQRLSAIPGSYWHEG